MDYQKALKIIDEAIAAKAGRRLNNVEIAIFEGAWQGLTYKAIAAKSGYEVNYLKGDAGHKFWQLLSDVMGNRITKTNFKAVLEGHQFSTLSPVDLYIERPPIESFCQQEILKPGAFLRIQGSFKMGKTLLLSKLINFAASQGYNAVHLPLRLAEKEDYETLDSFLKWLCISVSELLSSKDSPKEKNWWDNQLGNSKLKAVNYLENYLLQGDKPLLLGLDDLHLVYCYDDLDLVAHRIEIIDGFLTWLRAIYEKANTSTTWQKFRLILTYQETNIYCPNFSSSFNVGTEFELPEFNEKQVQELVDKSELTGRLKQQEIENLMEQVGGHPFLVQRALNELIIQQSLEPFKVDTVKIFGNLTTLWTPNY